MKHSPGPWKMSDAMDAVVAEKQDDRFPQGEDTMRAYGGYPIAESVARRNRPIISAAPDLYDFAVWVREEYGLLCPRIKSKASEVLRKAGEEQACPTCGGGGRYHNPRSSLLSQPCPACHGTGVFSQDGHEAAADVRLGKAS